MIILILIIQMKLLHHTEIIIMIIITGITTINITWVAAILMPQQYQKQANERWKRKWG